MKIGDKVKYKMYPRLIILVTNTIGYCSGAFEGKVIESQFNLTNYKVGESRNSWSKTAFEKI